MAGNRPTSAISEVSNTISSLASRFGRPARSPHTTREPVSPVHTPPWKVGAAVYDVVPIAVVVVPSVNHRVWSSIASNTAPSSVTSTKPTGWSASTVWSPTCTVRPSAYTSGRAPEVSTATLLGGDGAGEGDGAGSRSRGWAPRTAKAPTTTAA